MIETNPANDSPPPTDEIARDGVRILHRLRGRLHSLRQCLENPSGAMTRTRKPFSQLPGSVQMSGQTPVTRTPAPVPSE